MRMQKERKKKVNKVIDSIKFNIDNAAIDIVEEFIREVSIRIEKRD